MSVAVVLMAYGSPDRIDDVPAYYADIRGGRPISPEHLAGLIDRYRRLGIEHSNPLNEITEATRAALEQELDLRVLTGMRHWTPRIAEAVECAIAEGATTIVGLVLAPHYSSMSIGQYTARGQAAADAAGVPFSAIESWATEPAYIDFLVAEVRRRLDSMPTNTKVVFTAHSLPQRILETGDPYPDQLRATAVAVAAAAYEPVHEAPPEEKPEDEAPEEGKS